MPTIAYPNKNIGSGLGKDDTTVRPIEFEVDFSKVTAAAADDVTIGVLPKGTIILAGAAQSLVPGATAATLTLRAGATATTAALSANAAAGTIVANALTGAVVLTAEATVNVLVGNAANASGKHRFVLLVSEAVKASYPKVQVRDQVTGTA